MQCPLTYPLINSSPPTAPCSNDNLCSDDCSTSRRRSPFGVQFNNCRTKDESFIIMGQLWDEFTITKTLTDTEKNSASNSVISFGKHNKTQKDVVIKAYSVYQDPKLSWDAQGLLYELKMYESMRQLAHAVPHFTTLIANYTYNEGAQQFGVDFASVIAQHPDLKKIITSLHTIARNTFGSPNHGSAHVHNFMITTRAPGITLEAFFMQERRVQVLLSVLFQILFCLHALTIMGFQHNDLHAGNVIVDTNPNCTEGLYYVEKTQFLVPIWAKITIYDFDLSSCAYCGNNPALSLSLYCKSSGVCDERNPSFDMYTVFKSLLHTPGVLQQPVIKQLFQIALGTNPVPERFPNRMCNLTAAGECSAFPLGEPPGVLTPIELLLTQFNMFKVSQ